MIKINGVVVKSPDVFQASVNDIVKAERNSGGTMVIDLVATKRKLELGWTYLSAVELATLLAKVSAILFEVSYPDPVTGAERTGTFYKGDRSCEGLTYKNGAMIWKGLKFNVIER